MGQLLNNIELAANGTPYGGREYQRKGPTMVYSFKHNISILKELLNLLEQSGYSYYTLTCIRDTIQYLEEREREQK